MAEKLTIEEFRKSYQIDRTARGLRAIDLSGDANPKKSKYSAEKTVESGIVFDSKREAKRFVELKMLEAAGVITNLESNAERVKNKQKKIRYELKKRNGNVCNYEPDFVYVENGETVVEDSKGFRNSVYIAKAKLMLKIHGITIKET
jgi:alpha-L-fucosidase